MMNSRENNKAHYYGQEDIEEEKHNVPDGSRKGKHV